MFDGEPILTNGSNKGHRLMVFLDNISAMLINIHVQMYINKRPNGLNGHFSIIYKKGSIIDLEIKEVKKFLGTVQCSVYYLMGHDT